MADGVNVYVPIEELTVTAPFPVGIITFGSADEVLALLAAPAATTHMNAELRQLVNHGNVTTFAEGHCCIEPL